jgi:Arc/MetJ family transcription regulator
VQNTGFTLELERRMATRLDLDDKLIEAARRLGGHKTRRDAVTRALEEYVRWLRQQAILDDFGKIEYDPIYDYKKRRRAA